MKKFSALLLALLLAASCCVTAAAQETEQESAAQPAAAAATPDEAQAPDVLYGDVDGSGEVNIADATLAQQYVAELVTRDAIGFDAADLDFDDEVTTPCKPPKHRRTAPSATAPMTPRSRPSTKTEK